MTKFRKVTRYAVYRTYNGPGNRTVQEAVLDEDYRMKTYRHDKMAEAKAREMNDDRKKYGNDVLFVTRALHVFVGA